MALRRARAPVTLSLTPLIDVVFILLIFFMLVSQFENWRQLRLQPVAALGGSAADTEPTAFTLFDDGTFRVNGEKELTLSDAVSRAATLGNTSGTTVHAENKVSIQQVVDALEALSAAGLNEVRLHRAGAKDPS